VQPRLVAGGPWTGLVEAPAGEQARLWFRAPWRESVGGCLLVSGMAVAVQAGEAVTRVWVAASGQLGGQSLRKASQLCEMLPGPGKGSAAAVRLTFVISWSGGEMAGCGRAVAGPGGRWLTWMTVSGLAGGSALVVADLPGGGPGWLLRGGPGG
jgi:hypothetical protein